MPENKKEMTSIVQGWRSLKTQFLEEKMAASFVLLMLTITYNVDLNGVVV